MIVMLRVLENGLFTIVYYCVRVCSRSLKTIQPVVRNSCCDPTYYLHTHTQTLFGHGATPLGPLGLPLTIFVLIIATP